MKTCLYHHFASTLRKNWIFLELEFRIKKPKPDSPKNHRSRNLSRQRGIIRRRKKMCCESDCECRPLGFLLGLPFALLSLLVSIVGVLVWIVGLLLSCICPCCICVTVLVEIALELIKAPLHVMRWFTSQIPC